MIPIAIIFHIILFKLIDMNPLKYIEDADQVENFSEMQRHQSLLKRKAIREILYCLKQYQNQQPNPQDYHMLKWGE